MIDNSDLEFHRIEKTLKQIEDERIKLALVKLVLPTWNEEGERIFYAMLESKEMEEKRRLYEMKNEFMQENVTPEQMMREREAKKSKIYS